MSIDYQKVNWDTTKYVNPTNMNAMDNGIKSACDGVDRLDTETAKLSSQLEKNSIGEYCGGRNLIDTATIKDGYTIDQNGNYTYSSSYVGQRYTSESYIPVTQGTNYIANNRIYYVAYYDSNKTFVERVSCSGNSFTATHSGYMRIVFLNAGGGNVMLEQGNVAHAYEPFILSNRQLTEMLPISLKELDLGSPISWNRSGETLQSFTLNYGVEFSDIPYILDVKFRTTWGWNSVKHTIKAKTTTTFTLEIDAESTNTRNNLTISNVLVLVAHKGSSGASSVSTYADEPTSDNELS